MVCDLDGTVIHRPDGREALVVDRIGDRDVAVWTARAARLMAELRRRAVVLPATTRTLDQLRRARLGDAWEHAVVANGADLVMRGELDLAWRRFVLRVVQDSSPSLAAVEEIVRRETRGVADARVRSVQGVMVVSVLDDAGPADRTGMRPADLAGAIERAVGGADWIVSAGRRKVHVVARAASKLTAAREVARRLGVTGFVAAGDSLLDLELLEVAGRAVCTAEGEIARRGAVPAGAVVVPGHGGICGERVLDALLACLGGTTE